MFLNFWNWNKIELEGAKIQAWVLGQESSKLTIVVNKHYENEVTLREQNLPLKYCQRLKKLTYFEERFRSFHTFNIGSVGQTAAKLLAVKVGGLKKIAVCIICLVCCSMCLHNKPNEVDTTKLMVTKIRYSVVRGVILILLSSTRC